MGFKHLIIVFALAAAIPAGGQTRFVFSPQWMAQAQFAGYYVAKEKGFYDEEGLDVEINHPFATQTLEDRVRSGASQAYSMFLTEAMELVDKGIPVVNILQTSMNSSMVIVSRYGADPLAGKISDVSPIGRALIGAKSGERVVAELPSGEQVGLKVRKVTRAQ